LNLLMNWLMTVVLAVPGPPTSRLAPLMECTSTSSRSYLQRCAQQQHQQPHLAPFLARMFNRLKQ
jgi:hypothetical protein